MSVNVDFDFRATGLGERKDEVLKALTELLSRESLLDQLPEPKVSAAEIRFKSKMPLIISASHKWLPELRTKLDALEGDGVVIGLSIRFPDARTGWFEYPRTKKTRAKSKSKSKKAKPRARPKAKK